MGWDEWMKTQLRVISLCCWFTGKWNRGGGGGIYHESPSGRWFEMAGTDHTPPVQPSLLCSSQMVPPTRSAPGNFSIFPRGIGRSHTIDIIKGLFVYHLVEDAPGQYRALYEDDIGDKLILILTNK